MAFIHALHLVLYGLLVAANLLLIPIVAMGGYRIGELFRGSLGEVVQNQDIDRALPVVAAFMAVGLVNGPLAMLAMHNPPPPPPDTDSAMPSPSRSGKKPAAKGSRR